MDSDINYMMGEKRRRLFRVFRQRQTGYVATSSVEVANGVLYDEGNVQVLWLKGVGYTAIQYDSLAQLIGIVKGANTIEVWDFE